MITMTAFNKAWLILKSNYDPKRAVASSSGTEGRNYGENTELDICPKCKGPKAIGNETCWKCSEDYSLHQFYSEPLPYVAKGQPFSAEAAMTEYQE